MTAEQIKKRISYYEDKLHQEQERQHAVLNRQGWGYGMRNSKIGVSTTKEDKIKAKIAELKSKLK